MQNVYVYYSLNCHTHRVFSFYCMKRQETTFLFCAKHFFFSFAACSDGEFGKDCTFNCSGNCLNKAVCDKYKGSCVSCSSGYRGSRCDKSKPSYAHQKQGMNSMISRLARMLFQFYKQKRALTKNKTSMLYRNLQNLTLETLFSYAYLKVFQFKFSLFHNNYCSYFEIIFRQSCTILH